MVPEWWGAERWHGEDESGLASRFATQIEASGVGDGFAFVDSAAALTRTLLSFAGRGRRA